MYSGGKWRKGIDRPTTISAGVPSASAGLQIIDYHLWALQRMYERGENRFFALLAPNYRLIIDVDDHRRRPYGEYYTATNNPLRKETMMPAHLG